ncbi:MAG TPA: hypothetical protein VL947_08710, partial [Cytophagales bacterium]|nr:hypothetical protein [Cytophagales bacterium]
YLDNVKKCIPVFCYDIFNLLKDDKTGVDFHDKYPDLEVWRSLNVRPKKVQTLDASDRKFYEDLSDADWEVLKAEEEQAMRLYNEWSHRRQFEFIELVQGMLLGLCPQLLDMEADAWVVYAMVLADQYDKWKCCCEHIEIFIDYGFSSDILALPSEQYDEICYRRFVELMDTPVMQLRGRRIAGERV